MTKTISDEVMKFSLEINGNPAQKELAKLTDTNRAFKNILSDLNAKEVERRKELGKLNNEYATSGRAIEQINNQNKSLSKTYDAQKTKLQEIENQFGKNSREYKDQNAIVKSTLNTLVKYEDNIEKLTDKNLRLAPTIDKLSKEYKDLKAEIKNTNASIDANNVKIAESQKQIGLTALSMSQLKQKANQLRLALEHPIPYTKDHIKYTAELKEVKDRMAELNGKAKESGLSISSLADGFNKYAALGASVVAGLTGVVLSVQKIIDINGKLSDAQADVMKTTSMTKDEVDDLTKSFGLLKSRTARIELLGIAAVGGELNIAKNEIFDFVKVMDKASVALGTDFEGGAEQVANTLGKIKTLFAETKDASVELTFNAIGSALNDLGAAGNATADNVADFVTRIGTMPESLKPSIAVALGLGAAFQETGLNAEKSASNYSKVISIAANNIEGFAKVMGRPKKEMETLMNTDPNEFFLQFSSSIANLKPVALAKVLDNLKLNDNEVKQVISSAGNNTDLFRQKIELANKSLGDGTSMTKEFDIKNQNLAATLAKINKTVSGWFSSETFIKWLTTGVTWLATFIGATDDVNSTSQKWKNTLVFTAKVIAIVTAALITNTAWQRLVAIWITRNTEATILYTIASKARAFAEGVTIVATSALSVVTMVLTGNIAGATQMFRLFTATLMTTPWGFILGAVAAIGAAYVAFGESAKEAVTAQSMIAETAKEVDALVSKESSTMMSLLAIIQDQTASHKARNEALKKAKEIGKEYVAGLTIENSTTFAGKKMIDEYIKSLDKKITLEVLENQIRKIKDEINERKRKGLEEEVGIWEKIWLQMKNVGRLGGYSSDKVILATKNRAEALKELQRQLNFTNAQMKDFLKANPNVIKTIGTDATDNLTDDTAGKAEKKASDKPKKYDDSYLADEAKALEDLYQVQVRAQETKIALMQDGYNKELALEQLATNKKIHEVELQTNAINMLQIKLNKDLTEARQNGDTKQIQSILNQKRLLKEIQVEKNAIYCDEEKAQIVRIATIEIKSAQDNFKKKEENYNREKQIRESAFNEELAKLGTNKEARAKLKETYDRDELEAQRKFLTELLKEQQDILDGKNSQVDLSILSDEQKQVLIDNLNGTINKLSELGIKIEEVSQKKFTFLNGKGTDIFGQTPDDWVAAFTNLDTTAKKITAVETVLAGLQNAYGIYSQFQEQNQNKENKEFDRNQKIKRDRLKKQLDSGFINQTQYDKKIKKLDDEKEKQQIDSDYKKAKRERENALINIAINTAVGVMKAVAESPLTLGLPWSGIIAGMGIIQAALVPEVVRGAEEGHYGDYVTRSQDKKRFKVNQRLPMQSGLFNKSTVLVGEGADNYPEMVIDSKAWRQMSPEVKNAVIREIRGVKGYEYGLYNQSVTQKPQANATTTTATSDNQMAQMMMAMMQENMLLLKDLRENGLLARVDSTDLQGMKKLKEGIKDYDNLRNGNKI